MHQFVNMFFNNVIKLNSVTKLVEKDIRKCNEAGTFARAIPSKNVVILIYALIFLVSVKLLST